MSDHTSQELHEVRASFPTSDAMQEAVTQLTMSGFDRADLSLPDTHAAPIQDTPEAGAEPADTEEDARQIRTVSSSTAASVAAMAAAGITVATGGAALPAVAAAIAAGGAVGGATFAATSAANAGTQTDRDEKAATGALVLSARAPNREKRMEAEAIMRAAGGTDIAVT
jgi:hypothetical protein